VAYDNIRVFVPSVADVDPPILALPEDLVTDATGPGGATVTFDVSANDNVDPNPEVTCTPPSGALFGLGTTSVSCSAVDDAGNTSTGSFTVTVADRTAPEVTAALDRLDDDERRFLARWTCVDLVDTNPSAVGTINGVSIANPTEVHFKARDGHPSARFTDSGVLKVKGPSLQLNVTCIDAAGNASSALAVVPMAIDLGTLGGTFSQAISVNAQGQVGGTSNTAGDAEQHAFSWTEQGGMSTSAPSAAPSVAPRP